MPRKKYGNYALTPGGLVLAFQITGNNAFRLDGTKAACVKVKGKDVAGSVKPSPVGGWLFTPNPNSKNAHLLAEAEYEYWNPGSI